MCRQTHGVTRISARRRRFDVFAILMGIIAVPTLLIGVNAILAREFETSGRQSQAVSQAFETRQTLRALLSLHQDIETGQRGYVLTGNPDFLEPYDQARGQIDGMFDTLAMVARDNPLIADALPALRQASAAKLDGGSRHRHGKGRAAG